MPKSRISPHDRYIRSMMSNPQVIEEFFRVHLPAKIKDVVDFTTVTPLKDSFIDDKLRQQIADVLFSAKFQGKPGYLYLLLEHASKPDKLLPFRMLKYMIAIMDQHLTKTKGGKLPIIYPLILYTGSHPFNHSMDLFDLFGQDRALAREILKHPYNLIDLTQVSDEALRPYRWFGTMAILAKHIRSLDILPIFRSVIKSLKLIEKSGGEGYIYTVISYIFEAGQASDKLKVMKTMAQELASLDEEKTMTILEQFKPEIFQRGVEKGLAQSFASLDEEKTMTILEQFKPEIFQRGVEKGLAQSFASLDEEKTMTILEQFKPEIFQRGVEKGLAKGEARGLERGLKQGLAQKREALRDVAYSLLNRGMDLKEIAQMTGFSVEEIEALKNRLN